MIVTVGSDKGAAGATTLAVLLALLWEGERAVAELDPRGADLPFRLPGADGRPLAASPSIATLAVDARPGTSPRPIGLFTQQTAIGVPVVCGETSPRRFHRLAPHLPMVAATAADWPGTLFADIGCVQSWNPAMAVARSSQAVLLAARTDTESLGRLRERVEELVEHLAGAAPHRVAVAVVVRASRREQRAARARVEKLLASIGSPVPVLGPVVDDPDAAAALWTGRIGTRTLRSPLFTSGRAIAHDLSELCGPLPDPALEDAQTPSDAGTGPAAVEAPTQTSSSTVSPSAVVAS